LASTGMALTVPRVTVLVFNQLPRPTQPGHPSVAWVGATSTDNGLELCVTVRPDTSTGGCSQNDLWLKALMAVN